MQKEVQIETLNRGLIAVYTKEGIFLAWRLLKSEVSGYSYWFDRNEFYYIKKWKTDRICNG